MLLHLRSFVHYIRWSYFILIHPIITFSNNPQTSVSENGPQGLLHLGDSIQEERRRRRSALTPSGSSSFVESDIQLTGMMRHPYNCYPQKRRWRRTATTYITNAYLRQKKEELLPFLALQLQRIHRIGSNISLTSSYCFYLLSTFFIHFSYPLV